MTDQAARLQYRPEAFVRARLDEAEAEAHRIIADCEADLAILDDHQQGWTGLKRDIRVCLACDARHGDRWPCRTVRSIAARYRHRPGYLPEWAPEGAAP